MIKYLIIGFLALSVFSLVSYFFALNTLYNKENKKLIRVMNVFPFEVVPPLKGERNSINILLFVSLGSVFISFVLFTVRFFGVIPLVVSIFSLLLLFCLGAICFINLSYLKEHLYLSIGVLVSDLTIAALLTILSFKILQVYDYKSIPAIFSLVISGILLIKSLFFVFNPKIFNLNLSRDKDDNLIRPNFIPLAALEWTTLLSSPLYLIPIILLSTILR